MRSAPIPSRVAAALAAALLAAPEAMAAEMRPAPRPVVMLPAAAPVPLVLRPVPGPDGPTKQAAAAGGAEVPTAGLFLVGGLALGAVALAGAGGGGGSGGAGGGGSTGGGSDGLTFDGLRAGAALPATDDPALWRTPEFGGNYAVGMIGADHRYAAGATGLGTVGALLDTGVDLTHGEFAGRIRSDLSFSYYTGDADVTDRNGHGTHVAGILGAARDGAVMHGVAFDADLMVLKGFGDPTATRLPAYTSVFGDAMGRAAAAGATAMNNSWSYVRSDGRAFLISDFATRSDLAAHLGEDAVSALGRATAADMITVIASANDGASEVSSTAGIPLLFPEVAGHWIAVTSVDATGAIAASANRCGAAMDFCLAAPGVDILAPDATGAGARPDSYIYRSGTSMAAPHVTGAVLLLKSQFPELTGPEIQRILFDTATDLGAAGVDAVYGHGLLNLGTAMAPAGELRVQTGQSVGAATVPLAGTSVGESAPFAGVMAAAMAGRATMATDAYDRGYGVDLGQTVAPFADDARRRADAFALGAPPVRLSSAGQRLTLGSRAAAAPAAMADAETFAAPYDAFAGRDLAARWEGDLGAGLALTFGAAGGDGTGSLISVGVDIAEGPLSLSVEVGHLEESGTVLGTSFGGAMGGAGAEASTNFTRLGGALDLAAGYTLHAAASLGSSAFGADGIVTGGDAITSSALSLGATRPVAGGTFGIGLARPLSVTGGEMRMSRPVAISAASGGVRTDEVIRVEEAVPLTPAERPLELSLGYARDLFGGAARVGGIVELDDAPGVAVSAGWRLAF